MYSIKKMIFEQGKREGKNTIESNKAIEMSQLLEMVHHQKEAVANGATNTVHSIDTQIELKIGEKERAMGALERHQQEQGC